MTDARDLSVHAEIADVPNYRHPVRWWMGKTTEENLRHINVWIAHYADKLGSQYNIDEASVLVPNGYHANRIGEQLIQGGWQMFNRSTDVVSTTPFGTRYFVAYDFYRHPAVAYRMEIMRPVYNMIEDVQGFSPLHRALMHPYDDSGIVRDGGFPVPHLSFKVPTRKAYGAAVQHLKDAACLHAQSCQSTYGHFGYFIGNDTARQIYVKPRYNSRDAVA